MAAPIPAIMNHLAPHLLSSIDRINGALQVAVEQPPPATGTLPVCQATEDEWNAFADSEGQVVRPNFLEWFADAGEVHIIEFADTPHERYVGDFHQITSVAASNVRRWLVGSMAATNSQGRRCCPDLNNGPRQTTPGSVLRQNIPTFADFRTIKVEIGVTQQWGVMPRVESVLCVKFEANFANAEYKLYDVRVSPLVQLNPRPIVAPRTTIQLDGRRILGIPPEMALLVGFPAALSVD